MNGGVNVFFDVFLDDSLNMSLAFELTFFEYCLTEAVVQLPIIWGIERAGATADAVVLVVEDFGHIDCC